MSKASPKFLPPFHFSFCASLQMETRIQIWLRGMGALLPKIDGEEEVNSARKNMNQLIQ